MRAMRCLFVCFLFFVTLTLPFISLAAESVRDPSPLLQDDTVSLQVLSGPVFSTSTIGPDTPDCDFWQTNVRMGWILSSPSGDGSLLDGDWEFLLEASNAFVFEGFGDYFFGLSGLIRYNFTGPDSCFYPYVQAGFGVVYSDAHHEESQNAVGQALSFRPQAGAGFRYLINKNWSFDMEGTFQHISNAGMDERNDGLNSFGGFIGLTYYWDDF